MNEEPGKARELCNTATDFSTWLLMNLYLGARSLKTENAGLVWEKLLRKLVSRKGCNEKKIKEDRGENVRWQIEIGEERERERGTEEERRAQAAQEKGVKTVSGVLNQRGVCARMWAADTHSLLQATWGDYTCCYTCFFFHQLPDLSNARSRWNV